MRNELVAVLPEPKGDPELQLLKREHMTHFKASFAEAVAALDSADRLLLKQHLVERLTIDQLGALYHLHRASAARRIAKARDALLVATRIALARRLGVPPERLASVLELVASRLEASIERLLRMTSSASKSPRPEAARVPARQDLHAPARGDAVATPS